MYRDNKAVRCVAVNMLCSLMSVQELALGVLMVREKTHGRIERTGVSDARKAHFDPLAKQAGEKCAF